MICVDIFVSVRPIKNCEVASSNDDNGHSDEEGDDEDTVSAMFQDCAMCFYCTTEKPLSWRRCDGASCLNSRCIVCVGEWGPTCTQCVSDRTQLCGAIRLRLHCVDGYPAAQEQHVKPLNAPAVPARMARCTYVASLLLPLNSS